MDFVVLLLHHVCGKAEESQYNCQRGQAVSLWRFERSASTILDRSATAGLICTVSVPTNVMRLERVTEMDTKTRNIRVAELSLVKSWTSSVIESKARGILAHSTLWRHIFYPFFNDYFYTNSWVRGPKLCYSLGSTEEDRRVQFQENVILWFYCK